MQGGRAVMLGIPDCWATGRGNVFSAFQRKDLQSATWNGLPSEGSVQRHVPRTLGRRNRVTKVTWGIEPQATGFMMKEAALSGGGDRASLASWVSGGFYSRTWKKTWRTKDGGILAYGCYRFNRKVCRLMGGVASFFGGACYHCLSVVR